MKKKSPWIDRFQKLDDERVIAGRTIVRPEPVLELAKMEPDFGAQLIENALRELFLPSKNVIKVLRSILQRAMAHSTQTFPDAESHLRLVYANTRTDEIIQKFPTCLTGPAGVGKSALLKAFVRLMPADSLVKSEHGHPAFTMRACWYVPIGTESAIARILLPLSMSDAERAALGKQGESPKLSPQGKSLLAIQAACRRNARVLGISSIIVDELQFLTRSNTAVVTTSKLLQAFSELGPSVVFAANYSLCHKFMATPQETRQRFLSDPIVLMPDDPDSSDWSNYLRECDIAIGGIIDPQVLQNTRIIYNYTFGLKRLVMQLMKEAYRACRIRGARKITLEDFETAYLSATFSANLVDVEAMREQINTGRRIRKDLCCPFPVPPSDMERIRCHFDLESKRLIANQVAQSALTKAERQAYNEQKQSRRAQPTKQAQQKKKPASAEALKDSFDEYQNMLSRST